MAYQKMTFLFFAVVALRCVHSCADCNDSVKEFVKKRSISKQAAAEALKNQVTPPRSYFTSTPYCAVAQSLGVSETTEGSQNFTKAFDVIANGYFKACYGSNQETYDAYSLLATFLELLYNRTQLSRARTIYGKLTCLNEFNGVRPSDQGCASTTNATDLYNCLNISSRKCLFNIDSNDCEPDPDEIFVGQMCPKLIIEPGDCLGFAIDTTGSMSQEINGVQALVNRFIAAGEDRTTLCYVLSTFSDSGVQHTKIYDARCDSTDGIGSPTFSMMDGTHVYCINDLNTHLSQLSASGWVENGMTAIKDAANLINNIQENAVVERLRFGKCSIVLVTDAAPDDASEIDNVYAALRNPCVCDITVHCFFSGDANFGWYETLCQSTGGFIVRESDALHINTFIEFIKSGNNVLPSNGNSLQCHIFDVSLFVTQFEALFLASDSSNLVLTITQPDGSIEYHAMYGSYHVYTVNGPKIGVWKACVSSGTITMTMLEQTALSIEMEFVETTKCGELVPTCKIPLACTTALLIVTGGFHDISRSYPLYMDLIDEKSNAVTLTQLAECNGVLYGPVSIPSHPVKYQIRGHDKYGYSFAIPVSPLLYCARNPKLQVLIINSCAGIANPGLVELSVTNINDGPSELIATVEFSSTDGVGFEYVADELNVVLLPKQSKQVRINLTVPQNSSKIKLHWAVAITDNCSNATIICSDTTTIYDFEVYATPAFTVLAEFFWIPKSVVNGEYSYSFAATFGQNKSMEMSLPSGHVQKDIEIAMTPNVDMQIGVSGIDATDNGVAVEMNPLVRLKEVTSSSGAYGTDFFISSFKNHIGDTEYLSLFITTPNDTEVMYHVHYKGRLVAKGSVTKGNTQNVSITTNAIVTNGSYEHRDKGIHVQAQYGVIAVLVLNYKLGSIGDYLAFPYQQLNVSQYTYYAVSTTGTGTVHVSGVLLVGTEDNTTVTITPSITITVPQNIQDPASGDMVLPAGTPYTITLHRLQTFLFGVRNSDDISRSLIVSNKPLSVISGHECGNVPDGNNHCDQLMVQIPPTATWGKQFFLTPYFGRSAAQQFMIIACMSATSINVRCGSTNHRYVLNAGSRLTATMGSGLVCFLEADKPLLVVQLATGGSQDNNGIGDPVMSIVTPVEQFSSSHIAFYLPPIPSLDYHAINVMLYQSDISPDGVIINGVTSLVSWTRLHDQNGVTVGYLGRIYVNITNEGSDHCISTISGTKMGLVVYGFGSTPHETGYSYAAGLNHYHNNLDTPHLAKRSVESFEQFENYLKLNYDEDEEVPSVHVEPPSSDIAFIEDSPIVEGSNVTVIIKVSDNIEDVKCGLSESLLQDCSSGKISFFNLDGTGVYTFYVVATHKENKEIMKLTREFVTEHHDICGSYFINSGVTVEGKSVFIEFATTGPVIDTLCRINDSKYITRCASPAYIENLTAGKYTVSIEPIGCSEGHTRSTTSHFTIE